MDSSEALTTVPKVEPKVVIDNQESDLIPIIQNIVCSVNLCIKLNLKEIVRKCRNCEYNEKRLNAVIMRIREPRTTALIFANGKLVGTGAKDEINARLSARKFARILQKIGCEPKFTQFTIHNIVASYNLQFRIHLEALSIAHHNYSSYEVELFPGLVYRMIDPKIVFLVFASGKLVITGAKERHHIYEGFQKFLPVLQSFKRKESNIA